MNFREVLNYISSAGGASGKSLIAFFSKMTLAVDGKGSDYYYSHTTDKTGLFLIENFKTKISKGKVNNH